MNRPTLNPHRGRPITVANRRVITIIQVIERVVANIALSKSRKQLVGNLPSRAQLAQLVKYEPLCQTFHLYMPTF